MALFMIMSEHTPCKCGGTGVCIYMTIEKKNYTYTKNVRSVIQLKKLLHTRKDRKTMQKE
jgi:hypothetical protein